MYWLDYGQFFVFSGLHNIPEDQVFIRFPSLDETSSTIVNKHNRRTKGHIIVTGHRQRICSCNRDRKQISGLHLRQFHLIDQDIT